MTQTLTEGVDHVSSFITRCVLSTICFQPSSTHLFTAKRGKICIKMKMRPKTQG